MRIISRLLIFIIIIFITGCRHADQRLRQVEELSDTQLSEADNLLKNIDRSQLCVPDKMLYDLLTVRIIDNSGIGMLPDSTVVEIMTYYQNHDEKYYVESLYYGGKMYREAGDFSKSLYCFQSALDILSDTPNYKLKNKVSDNIANLLEIISENKDSYKTEGISLQKVIYDSHTLHNETNKDKLAEASTDTAFLFTLLILLILISIYQLNRVREKKIELCKTLYKLDKLKKSKDTCDKNGFCNYEGESMKELKNKLITEIKNIGDICKDNYQLPIDLLVSESYKKLQTIIEKKQILSDDNIFWKELEQTIDSTFSDFKNNILLLAGKKLKASDYNTLLLIKCNISPTQMSDIFGRTKSAISYRREKLSIKLFGEKIELSKFDDIIRYL